MAERKKPDTIAEWRLAAVETRAQMVDERTAQMPAQIASMSEDMSEVKEGVKVTNDRLFQLLLAVLGMCLSVVGALAIFLLTGR